MGISKYPSKIHLPPNAECITVLEYLIKAFPLIHQEIWYRRINDGKVHFSNGDIISRLSPYKAHTTVFYYREVENEPIIPFSEQIIFQDEHILIACKPHFLPVTPGGIYVNECLQNRLRFSTGNDNCQTLHRIDRETAGLVMFSIHPKTLPLYANLFAQRKIHKSYIALAHVNQQDNIVNKEWIVKSRIVKSSPRFLMQVVSGEANSHSIIRCIAQSNDKALFDLNPITGKTHQLRVHMQSLNFPLVNDRFYPTLQAQTEDNYQHPLQLIAKELRFIDPITQQARHFISHRNLSFD